MIIGISGKAGSGKDTIANIIAKINTDCIISSIADNMKFTLGQHLLYGTEIALNDFYSDEGKNKHIYSLDNMTVRELMQKFGTSIREGVHPDFWIRCFINNARIKGYLRYNLIIPDIRFLNEKEAIEDIGGIVIRVERPGIKTMDHISEMALDNSKFYYTILNDGTLEDLEMKVREFLGTLEGLKLKN